MAIADSLARLAGTLLGTLHTRLELISVEVEEEMARYSSYLLWTVVALFCAGIAILLAILLIVVMFWDSHREAVLLSLIGMFAGIAIYLGWWLRTAMRNKPRLFGYSLEELKRDTATLRGVVDTDEQL
ncbi:MAG: phage holin family protein [Undibacterium sp.]|nr:phage holin family protein [Undibacterium sp.]